MTQNFGVFKISKALNDITIYNCYTFSLMDYELLFGTQSNLDAALLVLYRLKIWLLEKLRNSKKNTKKYLKIGNGY